jgi:hypothetical protein
MSMNNTQKVQIVQSALAELGYHVQLRDITVDEGELWINDYNSEIPPAVVWQALSLTGIAIACWTCWCDPSEYTGQLCVEGDCQHPDGPKTPGKGLLVPKKIA